MDNVEFSPEQAIYERAATICENEEELDVCIQHGLSPMAREGWALAQILPRSEGRFMVILQRKLVPAHPSGPALVIPRGPMRGHQPLR